MLLRCVLTPHSNIELSFETIVQQELMYERVFTFAVNRD